MEILGWKVNFEKAEPNQPLIDAIDEAVKCGGWEAAKEVCMNTKGKAAFIAYQIIVLFQKYER